MIGKRDTDVLYINFSFLISTAAVWADSVSDVLVFVLDRVYNLWKFWLELPIFLFCFSKIKYHMHNDQIIKQCKLYDVNAFPK